jgi:hypothetical protein
MSEACLSDKLLNRYDNRSCMLVVTSSTPGPIIGPLSKAWRHLKHVYVVRRISSTIPLPYSNAESSDLGHVEYSDEVNPRTAISSYLFYLGSRQRVPEPRRQWWSKFGSSTIEIHHAMQMPSVVACPVRGVFRKDQSLRTTKGFKLCTPDAE